MLAELSWSSIPDWPICRNAEWPDVEGIDISSTPRSDRLVDCLVTCALEVDGRFVVIEHVPARVNEETGERFFSPETVERLQQIAWEGPKPSRTIQTPVFEFAV